MNQPRRETSIFSVILIIVSLIGLMWAVLRFDRFQIGREDFAIQWTGIRALLTNGDSPYSEAVTGQIRYTIKAESSFSGGTEPRFHSPIYSGLLVLPFAMVNNFSISRSIWSVLQLIALMFLILSSLKLTGWHPAWYTFALFSFFMISGYQVLIPWIGGGLYIYAALFLALALLSIRNNRQELGGILLALTTIEPQMVILVVLFILLWVASQRKRITIIWFFVTLVLLSVVGVLLVPGWILQYLRLIYHYGQNFPVGSLGTWLKYIVPGVGKQMSWFILGISIIILLAEWWLALRRDFRWFLWTVCLTMVITFWIGVPTIPGYFICLILPLLLISAALTERWPRGGPWTAIAVSAVLFLAQWGLYYVDITSSQPFMQLNMLLIMPTVLFIGLYWVRWMAIRPRHLMIEELRLGQT